MLPEHLELTGPFMERLNGLGVGAIKPLTAVAADADQADVAKNAEMLGDGRLSQPKAGYNGADGVLV